VEADSREGEPTIMRAFLLFYTMALFALQPLRCVAPVGQRGRGIDSDSLIATKRGEAGDITGDSCMNLCFARLHSRSPFGSG
jgi:hypothetical protein